MRKIWPFRQRWENFDRMPRPGRWRRPVGLLVVGLIWFLGPGRSAPAPSPTDGPEQVVRAYLRQISNGQTKAAERLLAGSAARWSTRRVWRTHLRRLRSTMGVIDDGAGLTPGTVSARIRLAEGEDVWNEVLEFQLVRHQRTWRIDNIFLRAQTADDGPATPEQMTAELLHPIDGIPSSQELTAPIDMFHRSLQAKDDEAVQAVLTAAARRRSPAEQWQRQTERWGASMRGPCSVVARSPSEAVVLCTPMRDDGRTPAGLPNQYRLRRERRHWRIDEVE